MTQWILHRWKRYGQDRLYAETLSGAKLGYLDMKSNELHPNRPAHLPLLRAAAVAYLASDAGAAGPHARVDDAAQPPGPAQSYVPRRTRRGSPWQRLGHSIAGRSTTLRVVATRH